MTMYDEIVKKYYGIIYNYCRQRLNFSKTAAEDVTQEVFFILYKKLNRLKMSEKIGIWLFRTADNEIKSYIRKNPSYIPMENCPEEALMTDSTFPSLEDSDFDCLTDEEKHLIEDYYCGIKSDVAKAHNLTQNTLYIRIHRIKGKLAKQAAKSNKLKP